MLDYYEKVVASNIATGVIAGSITSLFQKGSLERLEIILILIFSTFIIMIGKKSKKETIE